MASDKPADPVRKRPFQPHVMDQADPVVPSCPPGGHPRYSLEIVSWHLNTDASRPDLLRKGLLTQTTRRLPRWPADDVEDLW
jgi:hypothetical protein